MRPGRVIALVIGCLLVIPALALLFGGSVLGVAYLAERDDGGYFDVTIDRLSTPTAAVTAEDVDLSVDPGSPNWAINALDAEVRLRVTGSSASDEMFVGIGPEQDVDAYLFGVAHDEISDVNDDLEAKLQRRSGSGEAEPPTDQDFWVASASGSGTQELIWDATDGRWAAVVMNTDGSAGVSADVSVGAKAGFVLPLLLTMIAIGVVLTAAALGLIVAGATGAAKPPAPPPGQPIAPDASATPTPVGLADAPGPSTGYPPPVSTATGSYPDTPVTLSAQLDPNLSRWMWLVKWVLAIPHFIALVFLWIAYVVLTVVAGVAIVFTGRYPRGIFDFNVGVLRWSWRVSYYATSGGIGTDEYPPFSLVAEPDDAAHLDIAYPEKLSRPMVLVKWLLAIPHLIIVAILTGGSVQWLTWNGDRFNFDLAGGGGILGLLVLAAGLMLLFTERYPTALFDLIVGLNRWIYRVAAYVGLMTDDYPPFRLDQGGAEPGPRDDHPRPPPPVHRRTSSGADLRDSELVQPRRDV